MTILMSSTTSLLHTIFDEKVYFLKYFNNNFDIIRFSINIEMTWYILKKFTLPNIFIITV